MRREVDLEVAGPERRGAARRRGHLEAAQDGLDPGHQLEVVERLGDVVVGAELQALDLVHRVVAGGQHHDRDVGERPDLADHLEAVDVGQADVQQHDVRVLVLDDVERGLARPGAEDVDLAPLQGEPEADRLDDVGLVVDDEDRIVITASPAPAVRRPARRG